MPSPQNSLAIRTPEPKNRAMPLPQLSDGVISLVPFGLQHAKLHLAGEDDELVRWLNGGPGTKERVEAYARRCEQWWIDQGDADPRAFAIMVDESGSQAGYIDLRFKADYITDGQVNISYGLYPQWRGRGLVTRAVHLICDYATQEGATQAVIRSAPGNPKSAAVAQRAGFRFEQRVTETSDEVFNRHLRDLQPGNLRSSD